MIAGLTKKLICISILILPFLVLATSARAEEILIKGGKEYKGYLQKDGFINCDGERLKIDGAIIKETNEKCNPPTIKPTTERVVIGADKTGAAAGAGAAAGIGAGTIAAAAIGLIVIILLLL